MAGIDRTTGKLLGGWAHVIQSLGVIYTTAIGSRVMRRSFGSEVPPILGRTLTLALILRFKTALIVGAELWEPRAKIIAIHSPEGENTVEGLRSGAMALTIQCQHRPRAHLGDFTVEETRSLGYTLTAGIISGGL